MDISAFILFSPASSSLIWGWSVTAGPDQPDAPSVVQSFPGLLDYLSTERKRMGAKAVLTRQKRQPRWQPRSTSMRYKSPSSVSGVSITEVVGKSSRFFAHWRATGVSRRTGRHIDAGQRGQRFQQFISRAADAFEKHGQHGGQHRLGLTDAKAVEKRGQRHGVGGDAGAPGDNQGMSFIAVGGKEGYAGGFKDTAQH